MENIGKIIKMARVNREMSQEILANKIGCTKAAISAYEKGKQIPGGDVLVKIAKELEIVSQIFPGYKKIEEEGIFYKTENIWDNIKEKDLLTRLEKLEKLVEEQILKVAEKPPTYEEK